VKNEDAYQFESGRLSFNFAILMPGTGRWEAVI
jgi:hypothetical protein